MSAPVWDVERFWNVALSHEGAPYLWGRKGPDAFDCSGLITNCGYKAGGPDWRFTQNAQGLADVLQPIARLAPRQMGLVLYGHSLDVATHVMIVVGDGRVYGATGGDHTTTSLQAAHLRKACVKFQSRVDYRPDVIGFRAFELREPSTPQPKGSA